VRAGRPVLVGHPAFHRDGEQFLVDHLQRVHQQMSAGATVEFRRACRRTGRRPDPIVRRSTYTNTSPATVDQVAQVQQRVGLAGSPAPRKGFW